VVAATIYRTLDDHEGNATHCSLFSPALVKHTLSLMTDSDKEEEEEEEDDDSAVETPAKKQKVDPSGATDRTKLVLPNDLAHGSLLDYTPFIEHTGNESQTGKSVYIVAGLQVRRKV